MGWRTGVGEAAAVAVAAAPAAAEEAINTLF